MAKLFKVFKKKLKKTIPEYTDLNKMTHPKADYIILICRNAFVAVATVLFCISFFFHENNLLKAIAYFFGAGGYIFECLALTDCLKKRVEHRELFMVYCLGPLYLLMGLNYILWH